MSSGRRRPRDVTLALPIDGAGRALSTACNRYALTLVSGYRNIDTAGATGFFDGNATINQAARTRYRRAGVPSPLPIPTAYRPDRCVVRSSCFSKARPVPFAEAQAPGHRMDKQLFMDACRKGGLALETASRILDKELAAPLHRECRIVVRDDHDANDIVQETFIRTWKRCATYRGDSQLLPWIRGILRHAIVDHFRAKRPDEPIEDEEGNMSDAVSDRIARLSIASRDRPEDWLSASQREACYRRCSTAFEQAFPLHAAVMRWIAEDELSNEEIAELLQRSPGATREFISQCRKKARLYFADWYALRHESDG